MYFIGRLYSHYLRWKDKLFLKRHGCKNWAEYNYRFDPDINKWAQTTKTFYMNYPYIYVFKDATSEAFSGYPDWTDGYENLKQWCNSNCVGKWRSDIHRVLPSNFFTDPHNVDSSEDYSMNDIGGYDFIFFAFMEDADYIWFVTRWS